MLFRCVLAATLLVTSLAADAREQALSRWADTELLPYATERLQSHPRFKGQTIEFVVFDGAVAASTSSELALSLRNRLLNAAIDAGGIEVSPRQRVDQQAGATAGCDSEAHYLVGVEVDDSTARGVSVRLMALDTETRQWVGGFSRQWSGDLTAAERRALRTTGVDESRRGARGAPFDAADRDLLAGYLARTLSCALQRDTSGEYIVAAEIDASHPHADTLELVSNNLAADPAVDVSADLERVNAELSIKAHAIDDNLVQYWVSIVPTAESGGLSTLAGSAYVRDYQFGVRHARAAVETTDDPAPGRTVAVASSQTLLGPLFIGNEGRAQPCDRRDCSVLQSKARSDAVVFVLQYQANHGLVRLADHECRARTTARVLTAGEQLRFPVSYVRQPGLASRETNSWQTSPELDTYYAVAIDNGRVARRVANHIDRLPLRCDDYVRRGLKDRALEAWLNELVSLVSASPQHIDWRALEIDDLM